MENTLVMRGAIKENNFAGTSTALKQLSPVPSGRLVPRQSIPHCGAEGHWWEISLPGPEGDSSEGLDAMPPRHTSPTQEVFPFYQNR